MTILSKSLVPLSVCFFLVTGCGGGGSGGGSDTSSGDESGVSVTPPRVSLTQNYAEVREGSLFALKGEFPDPDAITVSSSHGHGVQITSFQPNEVTLVVPDVDRPSLFDIKLNFFFGDSSVERSLSLIVENTSAAGTVQKARDTVREKMHLLELTQDNVLYRFFIDFAYLNGLLGFTEKEQRLAEFSTTEAPSTSQAKMLIEELATELERYELGQSADIHLEQVLAMTEQAIEVHGRYGAQMLRQIQPLVQTLVPGLSEGRLVYVPEQGIYSRILSSEAYGELTPDGFDISETYQPIASLIRSRDTQSLTCETL